MNAVALRISLCALSAASTTTFRLKGSDSLRMKSYAPSFIDSITDCVVPKALVKTTIAFGSFWRTFASSSSPLYGWRWVSVMSRSASRAK